MSGVPPLDEVRDAIRRDLTAARARSMVRQRAQQWVGTLRKHDGDFGKALLGQRVIRIGPFGRRQRMQTGVSRYDDGPGRFFLPAFPTRLEALPEADAALLAQLLAMREGTIGVVSNRQQTRCYVARCLEKKSPEWHDFVAAYTALQYSVGLTKAADLDEDWRRHLRKDAGLVIESTKPGPEPGPDAGNEEEQEEE